MKLSASMSACAKMRGNFCKYDAAAARIALISSPTSPLRKQRPTRWSLLRCPILGSTALRRLRRFF